MKWELGIGVEATDGVGGSEVSGGLAVASVLVSSWVSVPVLDVVMDS